MNYKKIVIAVIILFLGVWVLSKSVYFERLDAKRKKDLIKSFSPKEAVDFFWKNKLNEVLKDALPLTTFDSLLNTQPDVLIKKYGKTMGVTSNYCFLIKGTITIGPGKGDESPVIIKNKRTYSLLRNYIFSNTARDATGYFKVDDFDNIMDFNSVSSEINTRILNEVIAKKLDALTNKDIIHFTGAVEINSEMQSQTELEIVPLQMEITAHGK
jgi:hypothetical protein